MSRKHKSESDWTRKPNAKVRRKLLAIMGEINAVRQDMEWSIEALATHAGVSSATASNLINKYTRFPEFESVAKLCDACGFNLQIEKDGQPVLVSKFEKERTKRRGGVRTVSIAARRKRA